MTGRRHCSHWPISAPLHKRRSIVLFSISNIALYCWLSSTFRIQCRVKAFCQSESDRYMWLPTAFTCKYLEVGNWTRNANWSKFSRSHTCAQSHICAITHMRARTHSLEQSCHHYSIKTYHFWHLAWIAPLIPPPPSAPNFWLTDFGFYGVYHWNVKKYRVCSLCNLTN